MNKFIYALLGSMLFVKVEGQASHQSHTTASGQMKNNVRVVGEYNLKQCNDECLRRAHGLNGIYPQSIGYSFNTEYKNCFCTANTDLYKTNSNFKHREFYQHILKVGSKDAHIAEKFDIVIHARYIPSEDETFKVWAIEENNYLTRLNSFFMEDPEIIYSKDLTNNYHELIMNDQVKRNYIYEHTIVSDGVEANEVIRIPAKILMTEGFEYEGLDDFTILFGQMNVSKDYKWIVYSQTKPNRHVISLKPITVLAPPLRNCRLNVNAVAESIGGVMEVRVYAETSGGCNADLLPITMLFHHSSMLQYSEVRTHSNSLNYSSIKFTEQSVLLQFDTMYIESRFNFTMIYTPLRSGRGAVIVHATYDALVADQQVPVNKEILVTADMKRETGAVSMNPPLEVEGNVYTPPSASMTITCSMPKARQMSPCYCTHSSTGVINYLPLNMVAIIGIDETRGFVYGRTSKTNIMEIDMSGDYAEYSIISQARLTTLKAYATFYENA